jgi:hypothetical protein
MKCCGGVNAERKRGDGEMKRKERDGEKGDMGRETKQTKQTEV